VGAGCRVDNIALVRYSRNPQAQGRWP